MATRYISTIGILQAKGGSGQLNEVLLHVPVHVLNTSCTISLSRRMKG